MDLSILLRTPTNFLRPPPVIRFSNPANKRFLFCTSSRTCKKTNEWSGFRLYIFISREPLGAPRSCARHRLRLFQNLLVLFSTFHVFEVNLERYTLCVSSQFGCSSATQMILSDNNQTKWCPCCRYNFYGDQKDL